MREYAPSDGTGFASWSIASELQIGHFFTRDIEDFWIGKEIAVYREWVSKVEKIKKIIPAALRFLFLEPTALLLDLLLFL